MGAVSRVSLEKFMSPEHMQTEDMWLYHTKTNPWLEILFKINALIITQLKELIMRVV